MSDDKNSKKITRRELIEYSGGAALGLGKLGAVAQLVLDGVLNSAVAQTVGDYKKKYIFIGQAGAPPRWTFDLPLIPDGDRSKFTATKLVGTRYTGGTRYTDVEYATKLVNGIHMPWMWGFDIPTPGGGFAPMGNLMDGMLMIRGVDTKNPAHGPAQAQHYNPKGIPFSLGSLTADLSSAPIAAISFGAYNYTMHSRKGLTPTIFTSRSDMLARLMAPYNKVNNSGYNTDQAQVKDELDAGIKALNDEAANARATNGAIVNSMDSAEELFEKDFGNLTTIFNTLNNKYKDLIKRSLDPNRRLAGINDKPVGTTGARDGNYNLANVKINLADLRDIITNNTTNDNMAAHFAATEFLITNELTSSIAMNVGPMSNTSSRQLFDEHDTGSMCSLYVNTYSNLALSSCLLELISVLKSKGQYQDTVIDLCGEFGRTPRGNGTGSDHSATGNCQTLWSGSMRGAQVIGNIQGNSSERNKGCWGTAGNNPVVGLLGHGHFVSTLSTLLEVKSQVTAVGSLLKLQNGVFIPVIPMGKLV